MPKSLLLVERVDLCCSKVPSERELTALCILGATPFLGSWAEAAER